MKPLTLARPHRNQHPNFRHLPELINVLSQRPHYPHSASVLGALLAPLAVQNHVASTSDSKAVPDRGGSILLPNRKLASRWFELARLSDVTPASRHSRRYVCLEGRWPGTHPSYRKGEWAVGVLDTDGASESPQTINFRFYSSTEDFVSSSRHLLEIDHNAAWRPGFLAAVSGTGRKSERPAATVHEKVADANRHLYLMMCDLATFQKPISVTGLSTLHLPYMEFLANYSPAQNAHNKLLFNPHVVRQRSATKFRLPPSSLIFQEFQSSSNSLDTGHALGSLTIGDFKKPSGLDLPLHTRKNFAFSSCSKDPATNDLIAWLTVRNDLALTAPRVRQTGGDTIALRSALINRTVRLIHNALRLSTLPDSPASSLLQSIEPGGAPYHALVDRGDAYSRALFRQLGWRELGGVCDLELEWTPSVIRPPPIWSWVAGSGDPALLPEGWDTRDDGSREWAFRVEQKVFSKAPMADEAFPPETRVKPERPRWRKV